jgi:Rubrerythrin
MALKRIKALALCVGLVLLSSSAGDLVSSQDTIRALQSVLSNEVASRAKYLAYSDKARAEGYPRLAYFARAMGSSEAVHARNIERALSDLGAEPDLSTSSVEVSDTRSNLVVALKEEIDAIDRAYPDAIKRMKADSSEPAAEAVSLILAAERQHRDLISKLLVGSEAFFGLVVKAFEDTPREYYVCQVCGDMVQDQELPKERCPVCSSPVSSFQKVEP